MYTAPVYARKGFLTALVALTVLAGALFVSTPKAFAGFESCASTMVCLYSNQNGEGEIRVFNGEDVGCKTLSGINPRSIFNNTGNKFVLIPGRGFIVGPGFAINEGTRITGTICIEIRSNGTCSC